MTTGTMLVTGATGTVGRELIDSARRRGWDAVGCSARGAEDVVPWRMGGEPPPPVLRRPWDVVVHAAARPRWNLPERQAHEANVAPLDALAEVVTDRTHLVHVSTAFATGLRGGVSSPQVADYRNTYEWSKAEAERIVRERYPTATIVRPPLVVGRRDTGFAARFSGLYLVLRAAVTGTLPAFIGHPDGLLEVVSSCDVASCVLAAAQARADAPRLQVLGRGAEALTVKGAIEAMYLALNAWRAERGVEPLPVPPMVTPDQWHRFYLPFSRPHLTVRQLRAIELLSEFIPYLSIVEPTAVTCPVPDTGASVEAAVRYWADTLPTLAAGQPTPWVGDEAVEERAA